MKPIFSHIRFIAGQSLPGRPEDMILSLRLIDLDEKQRTACANQLHSCQIGVANEGGTLIVTGLRSALTPCVDLLRRQEVLKLPAAELACLLELTDRSQKLTWRCGKHRFDCQRRTHLMGVVNVTPDSFSDGGRFLQTDAAIAHGLKLVAAGADIIDIGGESTRPGAEPVSTDEELSRVLPVISGLREQSETAISIDTYRSEVAKAAIESGAEIINDISGLGYDAKIAEVAAASGAGLILMHIKGKPRDMQLNPTYGDVVEEILQYLAERKSRALAAGVAPDQIVLDPGIGFGKRWFDNYDLINRLQEFRILGSPLMIGASRKSFLSKADLPDPGQRLEGTLSSHVLAAANGAQFIRVHDVEAAKRASRVTDLFVKRKNWQEHLDIELS